MQPMILPFLRLYSVRISTGNLTAGEIFEFFSLPDEVCLPIVPQNFGRAKS